MIKKIFICFLYFLITGLSVMGIDVDYYIQKKKYPKLKTVRIKQEVFRKKVIENMKGYNRIVQMWINDDFLITTGHVSGKEGYLEILSYPEFELKHRESVIDELGALQPLGYSFFYNNKFYTDGSLNHFEWITYYDLKTFTEHKAIKRHDFLGLFEILPVPYNFIIILFTKLSVMRF